MQTYVNFLNVTLFTDDANLFAFLRDLSTWVNLVNEKFKVLPSWSKADYLSLNIVKTACMVFLPIVKNMVLTLSQVILIIIFLNTYIKRAMINRGVQLPALSVRI